MTNNLLPSAWLASALVWLGVLGSASMLGSCTFSLRRQETRAINRTHLRLVEADTVQQFDVTVRRKKHLRRNRFYYWYAQDQVHRAEGEYNGRLLHGPYRAVSRESARTLRRGKFSHGTKTGRWLTWHSNGQLASSSRWHHGNRRGKPIFYDQQGRKLKIQPDSAAAPARRSWWRRMLKRQARQTAPVTGGTLPSGLPPTPEVAPSALPTAAPLSEADKKQRKAVEKATKKQQQTADKATRKQQKATERATQKGEQSFEVESPKAAKKARKAAPSAAPTP